MSLHIDLEVVRPRFAVRCRLALETEERLALFGPSGAGKTTLLEAVAGFVTPTRGAALLGETQLSRPAGRTTRRLDPHGGAVGHVSLVRQPTSLFPHLDVGRNISYGDSESDLAREMAVAFDLETLLNAYPAQLSGGQAQRVALARALSRRFQVLLLDEPMTAMDASSVTRAWEIIEKRCSDEGATALLVTHDLPEAQSFGHRLAVMEQGELLQVGDPHEVVAHPTSRRAAEVLGYSSFLTLGRPSDTPGSAALGSPVLEIAVDPSRVHLGGHPEEGVVLRGIVAACTPYRAGFRLAVALDDGTPVELPERGIWSLRGQGRLVIDAPAGVTLGKEILATVVAPPVIAARTETGRTADERFETPV